MLEELLKKPESYRQKVAIIITGIIGIFIFAVWLMMTQYNVKRAVTHTKTKTKTANQEFKENLPSLNEEEKITTELMKKGKMLENN